MRLFFIGTSAWFAALGQFQFVVLALALALLYWISGGKA